MLLLKHGIEALKSVKGYVCRMFGVDRESLENSVHHSDAQESVA